MLNTSDSAQHVEMDTDGLVMLECPDCRYVAGPGYYPHNDPEGFDKETTEAEYEYHYCDETTQYFERTAPDNI